MTAASCLSSVVVQFLVSFVVPLGMSHSIVQVVTYVRNIARAVLGSAWRRYMYTSSSLR